MEQKKRRFNPDRHLNHGQWREVPGLPEYVIEGDFSHCAQHGSKGPYNAHFEGAKKNLLYFGKLDYGDVDLRGGKKNGVVFDEKHWRIRIIGEENARIFNAWIGKNDPALNEALASKGIRYAREALERNSTIDPPAAEKPDQEKLVFGIRPPAADAKKSPRAAASKSHQHRKSSSDFSGDLFDIKPKDITPSAFDPGRQGGRRGGRSRG